MITKLTFINLIEKIQEQHERESHLEKALQKYFNDKDFTGVHDNRYTEDILNILSIEMHDYDDWIGWWLYEAPENNKRIQDNDTEYILDTPEKLYDYLISHISLKDKDDDIRYAYDQQTEGCKFAITIIDNLIMTNENTGNDGYEERTQLLKLAKNKIRDEYMLATNSTDDPNPDFPLNMSIITKRGENE